MTHDSRRYHRTRRPPFARAYGMLGALGGAAETAGSALGSAAGAVGSGLESAGGAIGSGLESAFTGGAGAGAGGGAGGGIGGAVNALLGGAPAKVAGAYQGLSSIGHGLQSLFGPGGGEAGRLAALGQPVPAGVELVGPSPTFTGPGFFPSVLQGFTHGPAELADPSAGTSLGAGVGQLLSTLDQLNAGRQGGMSMQPIVGGLTGALGQRPKLTNTAPPPMPPGPIMGMIGQLFKGF
jgi:hypothetical protein